MTVSQGYTIGAGRDMVAPGTISMYVNRGLIGHPNLVWRP